MELILQQPIGFCKAILQWVKTRPWQSSRVLVSIFSLLAQRESGQKEKCTRGKTPWTPWSSKAIMSVYSRRGDLSIGSTPMRTQPVVVTTSPTHIFPWLGMRKLRNEN